jgi:BMFP domain-containing protein YqiC
MFSAKLCDELVQSLLARLPSGIKDFEKDIQKEFKSILQASFSKLNLVSREEFDVQAKVLARTREKLDRMQEQLDSLS